MSEAAGESDSSENVPCTTTSADDSEENYASLNEYIFVKNRKSTEKELMELKGNEAVKKSLRSSHNWTILAASINEKHSRYRSHYVGWEGIKPEKDSDHGKVGRIQIDQREELTSLKSMRLVQRRLHEDKDISNKTKLLFPHAKQEHTNTNNIIISNPAQSRKRDRLKKSVRATSLAVVGKIFSAPSKSRRVLDRLTAEQVQNIGNTEMKRTQQVQNTHHLPKTHPLFKPHLQRKKVVLSISDESSDDDDTLDPPSEKEFGSTSTLAEKPNFKKKRSLQGPTTSPLEHTNSLTSSLVTSSSVTTVQLSSSEEIKETKRIQVDSIARSLSNETSSGSDCYSSQTSSSFSTTGFSTQSTQSSFEWEMTGEEEEERDEVHMQDDIMYSCQQKTTCNVKAQQSLPLAFPSATETSLETMSDSQISFQYSISTESDSSPVHEKPRHSLSDSWAWLELATTDDQFLTRSNSELLSTENSYDFIRQSVVSPGLLDTPLDLLDDHPLSVDPEASLGGATNNNHKLPDKVFEDEKFVEYCRHLDHSPPTHEDYMTYKLILVGELIDAKYGKKLEAALHEVMLIALKDKLGYNEFAKISHQLALQAKYVHERMLIISCLGRRLLEKMPNMENLISSYTTYAVEEMALVGLDWAGDNPYHNPEIRWDYDDWKYSNVQEALEENHFTYKTSDSEDNNNHTLAVPCINGLRRSSSVEVLIESNDSNSLTPPPVSILWKRRYSWGNAFVPPSPSPPLISLPSNDGNSLLIDRNDSIMTVSTASEVSLHLGTFRNCPSTSKPIVYSLSSQSSIDSVSSNYSSIRTIRGRQISSASSTSGTSSGISSTSTNPTNDRIIFDDNCDPLIDVIQPIIEESEGENNDREIDNQNGHTNNENDQTDTRDLRKDSKEDIFEEEERGEGNDIPPRRRTSTQVITEAMTSPVVTIGIPVAIFVAALTIGKT